MEVMLFSPMEKYGSIPWEAHLGESGRQGGRDRNARRRLLTLQGGPLNQSNAEYQQYCY